MSNDITKMYQFINNNYGIDKFMKDADYNGDNVIIKSEFENFLNSQGYSATKDVIDSFWKRGYRWCFSEYSRICAPAESPCAQTDRCLYPPEAPASPGPRQSC